MSEANDCKTHTGTSNEYVLNVAFGSFFGFTVVQFIFALIANSQAMMADCAAMAVDAITYLFNFAAERVKHRPLTVEEKQLDPIECQRQRKLLRLYMELIPPLISVTTLLAVTVYSMKQSIDILVDDEPVVNPPDVVIMLVFSAVNLLLDGVNVTCFARAEDLVVGIPAVFFDNAKGTSNDEDISEKTGLIKTGGDDGNDSTTYTGVSQAENSLDLTETDEDEASVNSKQLNLNMCSAWTHVFADTLRSITTLIAAGFAWLFPDLLSPSDADSWGAIFISVIIVMSLGPLIQGLISTATEIREISQRS